MLSRNSIHHLRQVTRRIKHGFTHQTRSAGVTAASQKVFDREKRYGAHNYASVPVALTRAEGEWCLVYIRHDSELQVYNLGRLGARVACLS